MQNINTQLFIVNFSSDNFFYNFSWKPTTATDLVSIYHAFYISVYKWI